jgi:hypothetical protein
MIIKKAVERSSSVIFNVLSKLLYTVTKKTRKTCKDSRCTCRKPNMKPTEHRTAVLVLNSDVQYRDGRIVANRTHLQP